MPLLFNDVGFGSALFLVQDIDSIFMKVASLVWLKARWLVVILTFSSVE